MAKKKKPNQPAPAEPSEPRQQMQDDGGQDGPETFANIQDESGSNFANINPD